MTDDPFAAFKEGQPPVEHSDADPGNKKKKREPHKKKIPPKKTAPIATEPAAPKKERKARKPRAAKEMRLPISMLLEIGSLSEEESGALLSIGAGLQKLPKKSRGKICAALGKIFG
jgi:hypothetical protein